MNRYVISIVLSAFLSSTFLVADDSADLKTLQADVAAMKAQLEGNAKTGFQLAGYASFDWRDPQDGSNEFTGVKFAPIFHAQYGSIFQFEGELEFTTTSEGDVDTELEYAAGTLFLNDYMGLQIGMISPVSLMQESSHAKELLAVTQVVEEKTKAIIDCSK
ncbi:hypothetical protein JHD50_11790 [Sulfurimonas sp. MAG313]|nr:hypothetical protein [Sulfurimonas sp. MAG313]MDF1881970.1 hypothetical protein [Sulfurimonas sp. MAG313]